MDLFAKEIEAGNSLLKGYSLLYQAIVAPKSLAQFQALQVWIMNNGADWDSTSQRNLATGTINLLIAQNHKVFKEFRPTLLKAYLDFLSAGWIYLNGQLEVRHFNNLITLLLQEGKTLKAAYIYKNWRNRLGSADPSKALLMNWSKILSVL